MLQMQAYEDITVQLNLQVGDIISEEAQRPPVILKELNKTKINKCCSLPQALQETESKAVKEEETKNPLYYKHAKRCLWRKNIKAHHSEYHPHNETPMLGCNIMLWGCFSSTGAITATQLTCGRSCYCQGGQILYFMLVKNVENPQK